MEEIRFTRPEPPKVEETKPVLVQAASKKSVLKKILKVAIIVILLFIVALGIFIARGVMNKKDPNASDYYAAFLVNGQVYFGELKDKNEREFVITNVYYLQLGGGTTAQTELSESRFSLVKLGDELHGPTDEMFINMDNLLFYEKLKKDSKVVESIISQNK